jgi:hypothetical protein
LDFACFGAPKLPIVLEPSASGIVMRPLDAVNAEVQDFFADAVPADVSLPRCRGCLAGGFGASSNRIINFSYPC